MNNVLDLQEKYPSEIFTRMTCLRLIRPHPGIWLEDEADLGNTSKKPLSGLRSSYDTCAIDILLTLIRVHITFGFAIDTKEPATATALEEAFLRVANKDLGWTKRDDWMLKRHLFDLMNGPSGSALGSPSMGVQDLFNHSEL